MSRTRDLRLLGLALCGLALVAAGAGLAGGPAPSLYGGLAQRAAAVPSPSVDAAVLPARVVDEVRSARSAAPSRVLVPGAVLASLVGLPALVGRTSPAAGSRRPDVRTRRHAIALRAPPLRSA